MQVMHNYL